MSDETTHLNRRNVLGITAGAIIGSSFSVEAISAEHDKVSQSVAPFVEATLTYDGPFDDALGIETECGEPNYFIHDSDFYIGDVDIDSYINSSPLALMNSQVTAEREPVTITPSNTLPIENVGGRKSRIRLPSDVDLPEASFDEIGSESAQLMAGGDTISVRSGREKSIELAPQAVEIEVPAETVTEMECTLAEDEVAIGDEIPETVSIRETKTEEITVTPSLRVAHHGRSNVYGVENGVALPMDPSIPIVRRAMKVAEINADVSHDPEVHSATNSNSGKDIITIHRGAN